MIIQARTTISEQLLRGELGVGALPLTVSQTLKESGFVCPHGVSLQ